jgi:hypothetical protein
MPKSEALFYEEDGKRGDAELHDEIMSTGRGDAYFGVQAALAAGLTNDQIVLLYGKEWDGAEITTDAGFEEEEHPRGPDGKWVKKAGVGFAAARASARTSRTSANIGYMVPEERDEVFRNLGHSQETIDRARKLLHDHTRDHTQKQADADLQAHIDAGDEIARVLEDFGKFELAMWEAYANSWTLRRDESQKEMREAWEYGGGNPYAYDNWEKQWETEEGYKFTGPPDLLLYRRGSTEKDIQSWTVHREGADTGSAIITPDRESTLRKLVDEGFLPVMGIAISQGYVGEGEVLMIRFRPRVQDAGFDFEEHEHPRGPGGKWTEKTGSSAGSKKPRTSWWLKPKKARESAAITETTVTTEEVLRKQAPINSRWRAEVKKLIEQEQGGEIRRQLKAKIGESFWRQAQKLEPFDAARIKLLEKASSLGYEPGSFMPPRAENPANEEAARAAALARAREGFQEPKSITPPPSGLIPRNAEGRPKLVTPQMASSELAREMKRQLDQLPPHHLALVKKTTIRVIEDWSKSAIAAFTGQTSTGTAAAGAFHHTADESRIEIPRMIQGRVVRNAPWTLTHELGHAVDYAMTKKLGLRKDRETARMEFSNRYAEEFKTGRARMAPSEAQYAKYWTASNKEMFAEVYAAMYSKHSTPWAMGIMTPTRLRAVFKEAIEKIRRDLDGE